MRRVEVLASHLVSCATVRPGSGEPPCGCSRCRGVRPDLDDDETCLRDLARKPSRAAISPGVDAARCNAIMRRLREFSRDELASFDGNDGQPVYIALKGLVFDVSSSGFYGPEGGYALLGGRDASRALAKMELDPEYVHDPRVDDLSADEQALLTQWYEKLLAKYPIVGSLR